MEYRRKLEGKVGVVTGGASGIGLAIAEKFIYEGGKIVIGDFNTAEFESITERLGSENCRCVKCNVSVYSDIEALINTAYEAFGGFDCMFGVAGIQIMKLLVDFTEEECDRIFDVNFKGVFNSTQAAVRAFIAHGTKGSIVNMSSINARCACPNSSPYAATKGAVVAFTRSVAVEVAQYGIRANCLAPGTTKTAMTKGQAEDRFPTYTAPKLLIKRQATPEEQANFACFLASDEASYATGEVFYNVGGWGTF